MRHLLTVLVLAGVAWAAPPVVTFPAAEVKAVRGEFVVVKAVVKDGKGDTQYQRPTTPGLSYLPNEYLADKSALVFTPIVEDGTFEFLAWSGNADGGSNLARVVVIVGKGGKPVDPVKPDPVKPDPVKPEPTDVLYFAVVRPNQATAELAEVMKLPAWDELRKAGHVVADIPISELPVELPRPPSLPVVMVLRKVGDKWKDTGSNKALPTTNEQIRGLLK